MPARAATPPRTPGVLFAVEGLDASGKSILVDLLARWLERRGRRVRVVAWKRSRILARAAADHRNRPALTPTVAALLGAADAVAWADDAIRPRLAAGDLVIADRYAWTGVARDVARGLDPDWAAALYAGLPVPDLVLYLRQDPRAALDAALRPRPASVAATAVGAAFGDFLARVLAALDGLESGRLDGPWPAPAVRLDAAAGPEALLREARAAIRAAEPAVVA